MHPCNLFQNFPGQWQSMVYYNGTCALMVTGLPVPRVQLTSSSQAAVPLVPLAYRLTDLFNDQINDDIFDGGNKLFQNPNAWGWRSQKPPAKDDINNAMVFLALNPVDNHIWFAISGDRMSTNGTSYLDFEFYQNPITKTGGPIPGGTGGFNSDGPHGGRTVGDLKYNTRIYWRWIFCCRIISYNGNPALKLALMIIFQLIRQQVLHLPQLMAGCSDQCALWCIWSTKYQTFTICRSCY